MKSKRIIWLFAFLLALASMAGIIIVRNHQQQGMHSGQESAGVQSNPYAEKLYQYRGTYTGDNSKVSAIVQALDYSELPVKSIALKTDSEPYGITVNYQVDDRVHYRLAWEDIETGWNKNAAVMFSLIPNAGEIRLQLYDEYGEFCGAYYDRKSLSERWGMDYFTSDRVNEAADSLASFTDYLQNVSAVKNMKEFYSKEQMQSIERDKQIYAVIGADQEIVINSGVNFAVTVTDEMAAHPPIRELADQKDALGQYTGKKIEFLIYNINNYKTNDSTFYLFAFDGQKLIASADLKTAQAEQNAIRILNALQGERK